MIYVTKPSLPPLEEFIPYLEAMWSTKILTNQGPFHQQFEDRLKDFLQAENVKLFNNCTTALLIALKSLESTGEVITTPYTFIATANAITWAGMKPVFVDVDPVTGNLDPLEIEKAINKKTRAIMPVHVYGTPCDTQAIDAISRNYQVPVIYDAAHAFGVTDTAGRSILNHGAMSVASFHATKVFNTLEGGAIICKDESIARNLTSLRNFGYENENATGSCGINGKMNEMSAALGLIQLRYVSDVIEKRRCIFDRYQQALRDIPGIELMPHPKGFNSNYSYFYIRVQKGHSLGRDLLRERLLESKIYCRKYFYPLVTDLYPYQHLSHYLPVANNMAQEVLCLPIYPDLMAEEQALIIEKIKIHS